jgi:addiction module HigA family antidote
VTPDWSVHPGEILLEALQERGLTQTAFAPKFKRPVQVVNQIIKGKKGITADTALDLESALGISAEFWMHAQADHNLSVARQRRANSQKRPHT